MISFGCGGCRSSQSLLAALRRGLVAHTTRPSAAVLLGMNDFAPLLMPLPPILRLQFSTSAGLLLVGVMVLQPFQTVGPPIGASASEAI